MTLSFSDLSLVVTLVHTNVPALVQYLTDFPLKRGRIWKIYEQFPILFLALQTIVTSVYCFNFYFCLRAMISCNTDQLPVLAVLVEPFANKNPLVTWLCQ